MTGQADETHEGLATCDEAEREVAGEKRKPLQLFSLSTCQLSLLLLLAIGIGVMCAIAGDYGISWDEDIQRRYGDAVLDYFLSWGRDKSCNTLSNLHFYGPAFELFTSAVARWQPERWYLVRHILTALTALITVPALMRIGRHLGSAWIGLLGGIALLVMPAFFGHAFINSKDAPFACLYAWATALALDSFADRRWTWGRILLFGLALGLVGSVRPAGMIVAALPLAAMLLWTAVLPTGNGLPSWHPRFLGGLALVAILAWIVMAIPWPFAHENIITGPIEAIAMAMRFPWPVSMRFEGSIISSDQLPRHYLVKYLLITTPPILLAGAAIGMAVSIAEQWRSPRSRSSLALFLLQAWLYLPILSFVVRPPHVYDGMRHFLFLLPPLALFHAVGMAWIISRCVRLPVRRVAIAMAVLLTLSPIVSLVRLHPYEYTYFNAFAGGLPGADANYETDYWITSYREAITWINAQTAQSTARRYTVVVVGPKNVLATVQPFAAISTSAASETTADRTSPSSPMQTLLSPRHVPADSKRSRAPRWSIPSVATVQCSVSFTPAARCLSDKAARTHRGRTLHLAPRPRPQVIPARPPSSQPGPSLAVGCLRLGPEPGPNW